MAEEENVLKAIEEIRKAEEGRKDKRKFSQTFDLIINLRNFDVRREAFNTFIQLPNKVKDKKVFGFLEKPSKVVESVRKEDFPRYKEKKDIKKLVSEYDFFIANAKLMPAVATSFGRVLGPAGKMPSPQLGIIPSEEEKLIESVLEKIDNMVRVRVKEPSIKIGIAKESSTNEEVVKNVVAAYHKIIEILPKKRENIRNVKIKLTMGKPVTIGI